MRERNLLASISYTADERGAIFLKITNNKERENISLTLTKLSSEGRLELYTVERGIEAGKEMGSVVYDILEERGIKFNK